MCRLHCGVRVCVGSALECTHPRVRAVVREVALRVRAPLSRRPSAPACVPRWHTLTPALPPPPAGAAGTPVATRPTWQHDAGRFEPTPVYRRETLALHQEIVGPAIVEERESTTVIARGDRLRVHESGALIIELAATAGEG